MPTPLDQDPDSPGLQNDDAGSSASPSLPEGDVHVWLAGDADATPVRLARWQGLLSPDEVERLERFKFAKDRDLYLLAHAHLRRVLSLYASVSPQTLRFRASEHGRPEIALEEPIGRLSPLHFSLSHTAGLVAVAVSRMALVGVDVENTALHEHLEELAGNAFAPREVEALDRWSGETYRERFFEMWTLKEAYVKATGLGMSLPLTSFTLEIGEAGITLADARVPWQFQLHRPTPHHQLALAVQAERIAAIVRWMSPEER